MAQDLTRPEGWTEFLWRLPPGLDLDALARATGALERVREIRDGSGLLWLAMAYGPGGLSLRDTAAWAGLRGLAKLSDVAVLKRLRGAAEYLEAVVASAIAARNPAALGRLGRRLRVLDGTTVSAPGSTRPDWRLHVAIDLAGPRLDAVTLTPATQGERLDAIDVAAGELVVADRGFGRPEGLAAVAAVGADFLVRLNWRQLRLADPTGKPVAMPALLAQAQAGGIVDRPIQVLHGKDRGFVPLPARLVVIALPEHAAERARRTLRRNGQREGYTPSPTARQAAGCLILLTSLAPDEASPVELACLYRLRWQVELAIKRLKSLVGIDALRAKDPDLARTWLAAQLLMAVLAEDLAAEFLDSPP
jgi:hypothetical protein